MPSWRNWISRLTSNQKSVGSSPTGGNKKLFSNSKSGYLLTMCCYLLCISYNVYRKLLNCYKPAVREAVDNIDCYYAMK